LFSVGIKEAKSGQEEWKGWEAVEVTAVSRSRDPAANKTKKKEESEERWRLLKLTNDDKEMNND